MLERGCSHPSVIRRMTATSLQIFVPSTFSPIFFTKEDLRCAPRHGIDAPGSFQVSQDAQKQLFWKSTGNVSQKLTLSDPSTSSRTCRSWRSRSSQFCPNFHLLMMRRPGSSTPSRHCVCDEMSQHKKQLRQGKKIRFFFLISPIWVPADRALRLVRLKKKISCSYPAWVASCADSSHRKRSVLSVVYSPCGTKIASASRDKTLRIWNAQTGQCVSTLRGHSG